ncbi:hypothetical protein BAUCODRAFT_35355 [Baudoinia panamericana UAMH 10762]|uniref:mRNA export factor MEX67 n=1 Tax=Baudoinia panamericana (strain UAMH 10762) TaxID=717646 RepID=M2MUW6_BAUPA|nr:uncharacterized protein BAUCODRAFT_35355 [Baudoinia panamericana UAMH 10762]EMC95373.1 hypothetical protein BAUCODRAFT_35355 [Baudoinia panamericana UAMH 10762]
MVARSKPPRAAPRGPAAARRQALRADKDGDVSMGLSIKGRAGVGKSTPPTGPRKDAAGGRPSRNGIISATAQRAILRQAGASDVSMKEVRSSGPRGGLVELKVTGWNKSKASGDEDGGVSSLLKWLEKKASVRLGSRARSVRIKKSRVEGSDLIVKVAPEDVPPLVRMNGYGWAGTTVSIERLGGAVQGTPVVSSEAERIKEMLRHVLERRYDLETKFLNLSALGQDEELQQQKIFESKSTTSKFFPAMMKVLEHSFDKKEDLFAAITSVSLANNDLEDLAAVTSLSITLPRLQNLDLSNNKFRKLSALDNWRRRFGQLERLILTGNPIEQNDPGYAVEVVKWYPNLRQLNNVQVRTEEEVANKAQITDMPFPIRSAIFQDEGGIAEQFVLKFFAGFDSDRAVLAAYYFDEHSEFSYAVNSQAPRDPAATEKHEAGEWEGLLKQSRNLRKIQQLPARQARIFHGTKAVADAFIGLPQTKHPDLAAEAKKWIVEARMVPGVPDPTGQSPNGVDGFFITVHGEVEELVASSGQIKKRSFDRTFILGPGGVAGVRIVSDQLTLRSYGGTQAFEPENAEGWNAEPTYAAQAEIDGAPQLPEGLTIPQAEQMVAALMSQTGMTLQYAKDCLDQSGWNAQVAVVNFEKAKAILPPTAFMSTAA